MTARVIVNGALGKMGRFACDTIENHPDFDLVAGTSREDNLGDVIKKTQADIVIDLTRADSAFANSLEIINQNAHPVIGTSGLNAEQITHLQELCSAKNLGGLIVPNFSIAAILMMRFAAQAAKHLAAVEIIEMHHPQKYDAPSGTAMKTAEMIAAAAPRIVSEEENELILGVRGGKQEGVTIHSLRLPGVLANQQVIFGNPGETLTISHQSLDRSCFMPGLILACQKVVTLDGLYYGLDKVI